MCLRALHLKVQHRASVFLIHQSVPWSVCVPQVLKTCLLDWHFRLNKQTPSSMPFNWLPSRLLLTLTEPLSPPKLALIPPLTAWSWTTMSLRQEILAHSMLSQKALTSASLAAGRHIIFISLYDLTRQWLSIRIRLHPLSQVWSRRSCMVSSLSLRDIRLWEVPLLTDMRWGYIFLSLYELSYLSFKLSWTKAAEPLYDIIDWSLTFGVRFFTCLGSYNIFLLRNLIV